MALSGTALICVAVSPLPARFLNCVHLREDISKDAIAVSYLFIILRDQKLDLQSLDEGEGRDSEDPKGGLCLCRGLQNLSGA